MGYPIQIAVTSNGTPIIGAKNIKRAEKLGESIDSRESVYGIQLKHRVVGLVREGNVKVWRVITPTNARHLKAEHVCAITGFQHVEPVFFGPKTCDEHEDCVHSAIGAACANAA